jgi:hypothetical protein
MQNQCLRPHLLHASAANFATLTSAAETTQSKFQYDRNFAGNFVVRHGCLVANIRSLDLSRGDSNGLKNSLGDADNSS